MHSAFVLTGDHQDHHSDYYDQNNNDHDRKIIKDDYQVNIFQNYSEQYYYNIQSFIPPPLLLFTWSKLMRTELFQKTLQNHESNHLNDNLPLEEATIQFDESKEVYSNHRSNNNNSDFLIDSSHHLDSYMTSLNVPEIDHTKCDKPYSCSACGVTFTQGSSLKLHIRSRHNDNIQYFSLILTSQHFVQRDKIQNYSSLQSNYLPIWCNHHSMLSVSNSTPSNREYWAI
ncbi:hypothetical protein Smp_133720 [Schistosoma mansoni]|uniref:hypothetical protein n=1 Tax=Schistosoma mansoni TaxID=6183 RepID=UPI00022DC276|nr:hypothetical protein Smp_133720 [Schistosoma mansoni]|eukprot:XP_018649000.1 hypothetical protein Smp_133720 [Schistosoma mansoni]